MIQYGKLRPISCSIVMNLSLKICRLNICFLFLKKIGSTEFFRHIDDLFLYESFNVKIEWELN